MLEITLEHELIVYVSYHVKVSVFFPFPISQYWAPRQVGSTDSECYCRKNMLYNKTTKVTTCWYWMIHIEKMNKSFLFYGVRIIGKYICHDYHHSLKKKLNIPVPKMVKQIEKWKSLGLSGKKKPTDIQNIKAKTSNQTQWKV